MRTRGDSLRRTGSCDYRGTSREAEKSRNLQPAEPGRPVEQLGLGLAAEKQEGQEKVDVSAQAGRARPLYLPGPSTAARVGKGGSASLSPQIQTLTSSGNTLADTPGNTVLPATGASQTDT